MIISDLRNQVLVCVCLIVVFELQLLRCPCVVTIVEGLSCLFSALFGCSEHTHFISYVRNKPIVPVSHLFSAHLSVISHLLVPVELFCFGQSSHKHQPHLVINYSCWLKRTRKEWVKEIWPLFALGNTNIWVLLCFVAQEVPRVLSTSIRWCCTFCVTSRYFFHLYISNYLLGQHILWKQCIVLLCCVWVLLGFFCNWLSQLQDGFPSWSQLKSAWCLINLNESNKNIV